MLEKAHRLSMHLLLYAALVVFSSAVVYVLLYTFDDFRSFPGLPLFILAIGCALFVAGLLLLSVCAVISSRR